MIIILKFSVSLGGISAGEDVKAKMMIIKGKHIIVINY